MANDPDQLQQLLQALSAEFSQRLRQELPELAQQAVSPSLIVIGEVVALRKQLAWFGEQAGEQA